MSDSNLMRPYMTGYMAADLLYDNCGGIDDEDEYFIPVIASVAQMALYLSPSEEFTTDFYDGLREYAQDNPNFRDALIASKVMTDEEIDGLSS